jgi:dipeptidyl aminopeptidase/acylaminoacyl peptidase
MGADFYMQPAWHPNGEMIAWAEWKHPFMAWDASSIKIGKLSGMQLRLQEENWIDGGQSCAASQPRFSPDGKWLSYIRRDGNWDSMILYNLKGKNKRILLPAQDSHLCLPNWIQGMRSYAWSADSKSIWYFRYLRGQTTLWRVALQSGESTQVDIEPVSWATQIDCSLDNSSPIFLGIPPQQPKQIWQLDKDKFKPVITNPLEGIPQTAISKPQEIVFPSGNQSEVYGIYFAPSGQPAEGDNPPALILDIHGGPTMQDYLCFSSKAAYFTSRGYAYTQINYRGSSGYGYSYQDALCHNWGVVDVEDTLNFAQELVKRGLADANRLVLKGSSAGGFTALNALIQKPGLFRAAICSYAVGNLVEDATNTHKFERFYHRFLTGNLEKDHQRFIDRSPIFHVEAIKDPVALFHGDRDKVVAPAQSVEIYEKLSSQGVPCMLKIYEGEGHGFRKLETTKDFYQEIEGFLEKHLSQV